jgi:hypothetical protein
VETYRHLTKKETGRIGEMFYTWIISVNIALLCFVILVLF